MSIFNRNNDLLSNYKSGINFFQDPFPHIIIENCLSTKIYNQMRLSYPESNVFKDLASRKGNLSSIKFLDMINSKKSSNIDPIFFDFFGYHTSHEFLFELIKIFNAEINEKTITYKEIYEASKFKNFEDFKKFSQTNIITKNTPSININHSPLNNDLIRGAHLDRSKNILGALFYFKDDTDNDNGGDLELYSWKNKSDFYKKFYFSDPIALKYVNLVKTIRYDKNKIVFFLNSINALHLVTSRKINSPIRKYAYLSIDTKNTDVVKKANIFTWISRKIVKLLRVFC